MPYATGVGSWSNGTHLLPSLVETLLGRVGDGLNGDTGGSYAPSSVIYIQGASKLQVGTAPSRTSATDRTVRMSAFEIAYDANLPYATIMSNPANQILGITFSSNIYPLIAKYVFPLTRLSNGFSLLSLTLEFRVTLLDILLANPTTSLPVSFPSINVYRMDPTTGVTESLSSAGAVTYPTPATLAEYAQGISNIAPHLLTFTPDLDKSFIDMSKYVYWMTFNEGTPFIDPALAEQASGNVVISGLGATSYIDTWDFQ